MTKLVLTVYLLFQVTLSFFRKFRDSEIRRLVLSGLYNFSQRSVRFNFLFSGNAFQSDVFFVEDKLIGVSRSKITGNVCAMSVLPEDKSGNEMYL